MNLFFKQNFFRSYIKEMFIIGLILTISLIVTIFITLTPNKDSELIFYSSLQYDNKQYTLNFPDIKAFEISLGKSISSKYIEIHLSNASVYKIEYSINGAFVDYDIIDTQNFESNIVKNFILIPDNPVKKGFDTIKVYPLRGNGRYVISYVSFFNDLDEKNISNNDNLRNFKVEKYDIDINDKEYRKISQKRDEALSLGILYTEDDDIVKAKLMHESKQYDIDLRLKGDWTDHLAGDKWSFRIELNGNKAINGIQKFSIQAPETRGFVWEWMIYEAYRREGGVALRYDFAYITVNGEYKGVYAVEEFFEKRVVENSLKREGPVLRINEDILWSGASFDLTKIESPIDAFSIKKTVFNDNLLKQFIYARELLSGYIYYGTYRVDEVFDIDIYAKYLAIMDVFGATHGTIWHNMRFYYNPVTSRLEPIPFDELGGTLINTYTNYSKSDLIISKLFYNEYFTDRYKFYLSKYLDKGCLDEFLYEISGELSKRLYVLRSDYKELTADLEILYDNQERLKILHNEFAKEELIVANIQGVNNNILNVQWVNKSLLPVNIVGISNGDIKLDIIGGALHATPAVTDLNYENLFVDITNYDFSDKYQSNFTIQYCLEGDRGIKEVVVINPKGLE